MKAMKFKSLDLPEVERLLDDDRWVFEQKVDGMRCMAVIGLGGAVSFLSHKGEPLRCPAGTQHFDKLRAELSTLPVVAILDGELLATGELWIFDLPRMGGEILPDTPFAERRAALEALTDWSAFEYVHLLPQARTRREKARLAVDVYEAGAEGLLVKRTDASYVPGGRVTTGLKVKYVKTADCVVVARNTRGKTNAELGMVNADGSTVEVGSCSMIGKPDAQVGDVVEVRYLYFDSRLVQTTLLKLRPDKDASECELSQLTPVSRRVLAEVSA